MTDKTTQISIKEGLKIAGDNFEQGKYQASLELYAAILKAKPDILIANANTLLNEPSAGDLITPAQHSPERGIAS